MSELGARLRQAREGQGVSLAQASTDTRILMQSLAALEEGAYHRLPGDVVTRGFIRNYAQYLALPADEMIELYRREHGGTDQIRIMPATTPPRTRSYVLPSFFGVFFVTVALVGLAYVALNAVGRLGDSSIAGAVAVPTVTVPPPSPLPTAMTAAQPPTTLPTRPPPSANATDAGPPTAAAGSTALAAITPADPAGGIAQQSPTPSAPIVLELAIASARGSENSWVRVQTDGNTVFEGILRSGEKLAYQAQRRVVIRAGNPPDVLVTVNGLQQGALGQVPGQPVTWEWPPN